MNSKKMDKKNVKLYFVLKKVFNKIGKYVIIMFFGCTATKIFVSFFNPIP